MVKCFSKTGSYVGRSEQYKNKQGDGNCFYQLVKNDLSIINNVIVSSLMVGRRLNKAELTVAI